MVSMLKEKIFKQPERFVFTEENLKLAKDCIAQYPKDKQKSALMPLLHLVQKQNNNWIPKVAMEYVADLLGVSIREVYEVVSFYSMYNEQPVGKHFIQVCRTTPCMLRGAKEITLKCKEMLNIDLGETTEDNKFSLVEVECLGACVNAPVVQINDLYHENVTPEKIEEIIKKKSL